MRAATAVALATRVVLSGCSVSGGESTPRGPIVRGTSDPPPGVDLDGVSNASALLVAHRRSLVDAGFVLAATTTVRSPTGPNVTASHRVRAAPDLAAHRHDVTRHLGNRTVVERRWTDGDGTARRVLENGTVVARGDYGGADARTLARTPRLRWFLRRADFEVTAVRVRPAETRFVLEADGPLDDGRGHLSVTFVVTGEGRIESLVATATRPADGGVTVESYAYRLVRSGGVTVDRPAWAAAEGEDA
jgi:hypothetical protein